MKDISKSLQFWSNPWPIRKDPGLLTANFSWQGYNCHTITFRNFLVIPSSSSSHKEITLYYITIWQNEYLREQKNWKTWFNSHVAELKSITNLVGKYRLSLVTKHVGHVCNYCWLATPSGANYAEVSNTVTLNHFCEYFMVVGCEHKLWWWTSPTVSWCNLKLKTSQ